MIETNAKVNNDNLKRSNKPKVTEGFINGKLYRGDTSGTSNKEDKRSLKKILHKVDYKQKRNKKNHNNSDNPSDIFKKAAISIFIGVIATIFSIYLINLLINEIDSNTSGKDTDNNRIDDIKEEQLSDFEIIDPNEIEMENDDSLTEINDNDFEIPEPILDEIESGELDNDIDNEFLTNDNLNHENTSDNDEVISNQQIMQNKEEAIFYYAKRNGEYGLVGYPLNVNIKSKDINEKVRILAKELLKNPEGDALTMIPEGTEFLGFRLINKTLYLNYSNEFNYNIYGVEGDIQQLAQIIYTFTSIDDIDKVAFLIEGNYPSSIGNHGIQNKEWTEEEIANLM